MKRLSSRGTAPHLLGDDEQAAEVRRGWYGDLRKADGKTIKERWNYEVKGVQVIRDAVRSLSDGECVWCGSMVPGTLLSVDHYLPKELFPRLAYCWGNYLPACNPCNLRKQQDRPGDLEPDALHDSALAGDRPYDPAKVLPTLTDRLIELTLDDPSDHLHFDFGVAIYQAQTPIGRRTLGRFFTEKAPNQVWVKLQTRTALDVQASTSAAHLETLLQATVDLVGCSYYVRGFAHFELQVNPPSWARPVSEPG